MCSPELIVVAMHATVVDVDECSTAENESSDFLK
jgi:hypothetical protein